MYEVSTGNYSLELMITIVLSSLENGGSWPLAYIPDLYSRCLNSYVYYYISLNMHLSVYMRLDGNELVKLFFQNNKCY